MDDAECGGAKEISEHIIAQRRERKLICKGGHTEKTDEAIRSLQEGEGVDAFIGDGNLCERLGEKR